MTAVDQPSQEAQRLAAGLSDREWQRLIVQLGRYAFQRSRRFYWRTGAAGELPAGEVTESIVSKAVLLWLSGRRRWNHDEYADLQSFLQGAIDSLLSHAADGFENRRFDARSPDPDDRRWLVRATPETELLDRERAREADEILSEILHRAQGDEVAVAIAEAMRRGAATRRDLIAATGRSADAVDNGLKRLRRLGAAVAHERRKNRHELRQVR